MLKLGLEGFVDTIVDVVFLWPRTGLCGSWTVLWVVAVRLAVLGRVVKSERTELVFEVVDATLSERILDSVSDPFEEKPEEGPAI